ncbi:5-(carboxyamino)imidazole ribonucleotide synthase [Quadrisphaera granulorum]|uniref:N5-carboxyaminoimidazole ribonucleotide synthase n=1 Tax=Quadrisphaera granulorum TaxID=317664 RepID=A0A316A7J5_9ACTN|nr:5-(carboxyamino)imidazole ribonucleotide synthase [Quadrisphaera granulorum]PWJ52794.1 5-(carboxyamino)imidazole ribonucleotide synthase [Quadrisphaera granulorum]SZE97399.1 5-(carboxyamino)imidazole ribonucleotide synthase [Quadrisphaera granulorum]
MTATPVESPVDQALDASDARQARDARAGTAGATETTFPVVAVVGAGQLARMTVPPAVGLGARLRVLATDPEESAAQVVPDVQLGSPDDLATLRRLAEGAAALTLDHEQVPTEHLRALEAEGVAVRPGPDALEHAQDKLLLRRRLDAMGVPGPAWAEIRSTDDLRAFGERAGWPLVLKTPRGGYDGKGVLVVGSVDDAAAWLERAAGEPLLAEEAVKFTRELAVMVARSPSGQAAAWPVVETVQVGGVCREVIAPAPDLDDDLAAEATALALRLAGELGVTGVMAVEGFEVPTGGGSSRFLVNELAMRPHNSGHWSIEGSVTSQFEQHLRAVLDLPLGSTAPRARWTVMVNALGGDYPDLFHSHLHVMARDPAVKVHLYGKSVRPGRKIGHVTAWGDDLADVRARAAHAADYITGTVDG